MPMKADIDLVLTPRVRPGDILSGPLQEESVYLDKVKSGLGQILIESLKKPDFDPRACAKRIKATLSNEIFSVSVGPDGFTLTPTGNLKFSVDNTAQATTEP
jgi:hypothetical protein